jgi:hypothetical protein
MWAISGCRKACEFQAGSFFKRGHGQIHCLLPFRGIRNGHLPLRSLQRRMTCGLSAADQCHLSSATNTRVIEPPHGEISIRWRACFGNMSDCFADKLFNLRAFNF